MFLTWLLHLWCWGRNPGPPMCWWGVGGVGGRWGGGVAVTASQPFFNFYSSFPRSFIEADRTATSVWLCWSSLQLWYEGMVQSEQIISNFRVKEPKHKMNSKKLRHKIMNSLRNVFTVPGVMARFRNFHYLVYFNIWRSQPKYLRYVMGKPLEKSRWTKERRCCFKGYKQSARQTNTEIPPQTKLYLLLVLVKS